MHVMIATLIISIIIFLFSRVLRLQATGLVSKWMIDHTPQVEDCSTGGAQRTLNMNDLMGVFITPFIAIMIAFGILIIENLYHKFGPKPDLGEKKQSK